MPELPEVEVTRRQLEPLLVGRTILDGVTTPASSFCLTPPSALREALRGRRVRALARHGKSLLCCTPE